jgi:hypothetical protein
MGQGGQRDPSFCPYVAQFLLLLSLNFFFSVDELSVTGQVFKVYLHTQGVCIHLGALFVAITCLRVYWIFSCETIYIYIYNARYIEVIKLMCQHTA